MNGLSPELVLRHGCALALALVAGLSGVAQAERTGPREGWREAVISVSDLRRAEEAWRELAGYRVVDREGAGAGPGWSLLATEGEPDRHLRLVAFGEPEAVQIRSSAQPWDTGGWFDLMVRTRELAAVFEDAQRRGWLAYSDPVEVTFGGAQLGIVILRGPDGVNVGLYERIEPPLRDWPAFERLSAPFNAMEIVRDLDASIAFYREGLGLEVVWRGEFAEPGPGPSNFGLPHNLAPELEREVAILHPSGGERGRLELVHWPDLEGRHYGERAVPPNLGLLALRFEVADAAVWADELRRRGIPLATPPTVTTLPPHGPVMLFGVRSPDGSLVEFFSDPPR